MSAYIIVSLIIAAVGIASSVVTYNISRAEAIENYDKYDAFIDELVSNVKSLTKERKKLLYENSILQAQLAEEKTRFNPSQDQFLEMPNKKSYQNLKNSDFFELW